MLWKPVTVGEATFQYLHERLARHIDFIADSDLEFLVPATRFLEFAQLSATLEVFMRALRSVATTYAASPRVQRPGNEIVDWPQKQRTEWLILRFEAVRLYRLIDAIANDIPRH